MLRHTLVLLLCILWINFETVQIAAVFDPDRLRLVDVNSTTGSILVRGNAPMNASGHFDPNMLLQSVPTQLNIVPHNNHSTFSKLIVVSLLSDSQSDERLILHSERRGCESEHQHDFSVHLIHAPVVGSWCSLFPSWLPLVVGDSTGGAWNVASQLHSLLHQQHHGDRTLIYVHCMRGIDRTGLVTGAYSLRYQQATLDQVQKRNFAVGNRRIQWLEEQSLAAAHQQVQSYKRTLQ